MKISPSIRRRLDELVGPRLVALAVLCHGAIIIVLSLGDQLILRRSVRLDYLAVDINLGIGLTLIYLSALLDRRKRTALVIASVAYAFYLGTNIEGLTDLLGAKHHVGTIFVLRDIVLPILILLLLFFNRHKYVVRSDSQSFRTAIIISGIMLGVTFVYGTLGFYILGPRGFHQTLSVPAAMHYTVDQLNLTTNHPVHAYSRRANLFDDSLSFISSFAVLYVLFAFVQPIRARFGDQRAARAKFRVLLYTQHDAVSEDYFKLWPTDKNYFFDSSETSGLAYHVYRGTALILGGPAGKKARYKQLLSEFQYVCHGNDWQPAVIHADDALLNTYKGLGFSIQKLGEEAIVNLHQFGSETVGDKYFRNITNRFNKQGYSFELLKPPHHQAVMTRLKEISTDWLSRDNHVERGYAMGYFEESYIGICDVAVARDAAGTIQAFLNLVPAAFDKQEATYDLLRPSKQALGNVNDYLLINLCQQLLQEGYERLNLGLCPLVGLEGDESKGLIGGFLSFAYANGDRFYSFSGLYRFKNKYQPVWKPRYVVYVGGIRGFSKTMNALMRAMSSVHKNYLTH